LLWAGDRYLVGYGSGADFARYVVVRSTTGSHDLNKRLNLGGRISLPRRPGKVNPWAWDSVGPLHIGLAQVMGNRNIRFVNVALAGQAIDAAAYFQRNHDVLSVDVLWDGAGYVMAWTEREEPLRTQLFLTRFSCPNES